ncbi:ABC transporter substrate-binding protein [Halobacterium litoreum]|uniref:ABC transporter substrate-binding protein n=1 Tax=Halobacterium litoreum TaxID=2039234 RepID=A0ABD5NF60_9EURY|nr:ABC transporter substrate-binding protein [Halobacterium litoreum]UHH13436.1 ABC transporter substrate-binding protein [Halobacterium litoreum]
MFGESDDDGLTRRTYLAGGATLLGGALAGCTSPATDDETTQTTGAPTTDAETAGSGDTDASASYAVSMEPVGAVEFDGVPETWVANNGSWADMGVALGLEPPEALWLTSRYHTQYYDAIDGLSVDKSGMVSLFQDGVSKERFLDLDADIHVMDPNFLMNRFEGWSEKDVAEIEERVAPLFGNCIYAQHYPWHDDYRYYTLMEGFEKLAQVFQRTDRYEAFESIHDDFQSNLAPVVPSAGDRPEVAVVWGIGDQPTEFYPYVIGGGTGFKHLRDLNVRDALAESGVKDFHGTRAAIDVETLLNVDPEVLLLRGYEAKTDAEFRNTVVASLEDHAAASNLTAVQNGDVYRAGGLYQGPITNLVLTERLARDLYGAEETLFDRERVVAAVEGDV